MTKKFFARPIFQVRDVAASIAYYRDQLGFNVEWEHGEERLIIAAVERDGFQILLDAASVIPRPAVPSVLAISVDDEETLRELYRSFSERGAKVSQPFETPWQKGNYELDVQDLDGNVLVFWGATPQV